MDNLANLFKRINSWFKTRKFDLEIVILAILVILLLIGQWRLEKIVPEKEPIRVEGIE